MTSPVPSSDLSKLHIDRGDPPPGVRRAFRRNLILGLGLLVVVVAVVFAVGRGGAVPVQVMVVAPASRAGEGPAGNASVTANGYVVARTRASVAAKLPGRIAELRVSEGSTLRRGEVIARLENADYQAQAAQAEAALLTARAELVEARAERDVLARDARRLSDMRAKSPELVAEQEYDMAQSRAAQAAARAQASEARIASADANLRFARANLENTVIRAPFTGTVLRKEAEIGEVVAPSVGGGLTRGAVVTMAGPAAVHVG